MHVSIHYTDERISPKSVFTLRTMSNYKIGIKNENSFASQFLHTKVELYKGFKEYVHSTVAKDIDLA